MDMWMRKAPFDAADLVLTLTVGVFVVVVSWTMLVGCGGQTFDVAEALSIDAGDEGQCLDERNLFVPCERENDAKAPDGDVSGTPDAHGDVESIGKDGEAPVSETTPADTSSETGTIIDTSASEASGCMYVHRAPLGSTPTFESCLPTGDVSRPITYTDELIAEDIAHVEADLSGTFGPAIVQSCETVGSGNARAVLWTKPDDSTALLVWGFSGDLAGKFNAAGACPTATDPTVWW